MLYQVPSLIVMVDALISRMSIATVERNSKLVNVHFYQQLVYDHDCFFVELNCLEILVLEDT